MCVFICTRCVRNKDNNNNNTVNMEFESDNESELEVEVIQMVKHGMKTQIQKRKTRISCS